MTDLLHTQEGVLRQADAVMRATGGRAVLLRLPSPAVPNDDSEQLGLATPQFQDIPLAPVNFRKADSASIVLLVSASAMKAVAGTLAFNSVELLFEAAAGLVIDQVLYEIAQSRTSQAMGEPYCYCLTLRAPVQ